MRRFIVEDAFWQVFPEARIGAVICRGINNTVKDAERYEEMLRQAEKDAHRFFRKGRVQQQSCGGRLERGVPEVQDEEGGQELPLKLC